MMSKFKQALNSGKFVVTSEIGPPKGTNIENMRHHIDILKDKVDAINVTDHQSSVMRFPSIGGCLEIIERGGEPILQMTCRDRNRRRLSLERYRVNRAAVPRHLGDVVHVLERCFLHAEHTQNRRNITTTVRRECHLHIIGLVLRDTR